MTQEVNDIAWRGHWRENWVNDDSNNKMYPRAELVGGFKHGHCRWV